MFRQLQMVAAGDLRLFGLLLFFVIFVAAVVRAFVIRRREDYAALSRLPLEGDDHRQEHAP
jgi:cbb3-type cytochrome oxidase subunit 3